MLVNIQFHSKIHGNYDIKIFYRLISGNSFNLKHLYRHQCSCLSCLCRRSYGKLSETNMSATRDAVGRFLGSDEMSPHVLEMNWIDATEMWLNINTSPLLPPFETSRGLLVTKISAIPHTHFFVPYWCSWQSCEVVFTSAVFIIRCWQFLGLCSVEWYDDFMKDELVRIWKEMIVAWLGHRIEWSHGVPRKIR
jgi:hypothetical protein